MNSIYSIGKKLRGIIISPYTLGIVSLLIGYWLNYIDAILDTILTSLPESCITVITVLILLKKRSLIDIYFLKESIKNVLLPVIPTIIFNTMLEYWLHFNHLEKFFLTEILMSIMVIYLIKINNILNEEINYIKIITYVVLTDFVMIFLTDGFYALIVTSVLDKNINEINHNVWLNALLSLVPRLIQILLLVLYFYKNSIQERISYIEIIFKNKVLSLSTLIFIASTLFGGFAIAGFLAETNILREYEFTKQVLASVLVLLLPSIIVSSYIISICNLINNNIKLQKEKENIYGDNDII